MSNLIIPIKREEHLSLLNIGIHQANVNFKNVRMESDEFICIREESGGTAQIVIVDMKDPRTPIRIPLSVDSAIVNPVHKILALKTQKFMKIYNIETNKEINARGLAEEVLFWKWISANTIGLVTLTAVYHWNMEGIPKKIFDRHDSLVGSLVVNYRANHDQKWLLLTAFSMDKKMVVGRLQLYCVENKSSQCLDGQAGTFAQFTGPGNLYTSNVLCYAVRNLSGAKLHIIEVGEVLHGNKPLTRIETDIYFPPDALMDFPVAIQASTKYEILYLITKWGYIHLFDFESGLCIYTKCISSDTIFVTTPHQSSGGIMCANLIGQIFSVTVDESKIVAYTSNNFGTEHMGHRILNKKKDSDFFTQLVEQFDSLLRKSAYIEACKVADKIFSNPTTAPEDKSYVIETCKKTKLFKMALENYTEFNDLKMLVVHSDLVDPQWLISYFGTFTLEHALECIDSMLKQNLKQNLDICVRIAVEYHEQLTATALISVFESHNCYDGIFFFLTPIINASVDPEVHFKYIEAGCKTGEVKEVERMCQDSKFYDPNRVKEMLMSEKLAFMLALILVCDRFNFIHDLVSFLFSNNLQKYIKFFVQKVNQSRLPAVVGALMDVNCPESVIVKLIMLVERQFSSEQLIAEVEKRNRLRMILPWLEYQIKHGVADPAIRSSYAKICTDSNNNQKTHSKKLDGLYPELEVGKTNQPHPIGFTLKSQTTRLSPSTPQQFQYQPGNTTVNAVSTTPQRINTEISAPVPPPMPSNNHYLHINMHSTKAKDLNPKSDSALAGSIPPPGMSSTNNFDNSLNSGNPNVTQGRPGGLMDELKIGVSLRKVKPKSSDKDSAVVIKPVNLNTTAGETRTPNIPSPNPKVSVPFEGNLISELEAILKRKRHSSDNKSLVLPSQEQESSNRSEKSSAIKQLPNAPTLESNQGIRNMPKGTIKPPVPFKRKGLFLDKSNVSVFSTSIKNQDIRTVGEPQYQNTITSDIKNLANLNKEKVDKRTVPLKKDNRSVFPKPSPVSNNEAEESCETDLDNEIKLAELKLKKKQLGRRKGRKEKNEEDEATGESELDLEIELQELKQRKQKKMKKKQRITSDKLGNEGIEDRNPKGCQPIQSFNPFYNCGSTPFDSENISNPRENQRNQLDLSVGTENLTEAINEISFEYQRTPINVFSKNEICFVPPPPPPPPPHPPCLLEINSDSNVIKPIHKNCGFNAPNTQSQLERGNSRSSLLQEIAIGIKLRPVKDSVSKVQGKPRATQDLQSVIASAINSRNGLMNPSSESEDSDTDEDIDWDEK